MTTAKIAALQQIQGIQRFFKSPTVKDGIVLVKINKGDPLRLRDLFYLIVGKLILRRQHGNLTVEYEKNRLQAA